MGQQAGDDILHHTLGNDGIGLGENGAAREQLGLGWVTTRLGIVL